MTNIKKGIIQLLPFIGYVALIVIVFGRALFPASNELIYGDDIHHQYWFYRQYFLHALKDGEFPWWNPYHFSGSPFVANPIPNLWYPLSWVFVLVPLHLAYSWYIAFHVFLAMVGMYWMMDVVCRLKSSFSLGRFMPGVVFGLSGFFMARVWAGHVDVIAAASLMPFVFGSFWKAIDLAKRKKATKKQIIRVTVAAGVALGLQLLAGYQTIALFTMEAVGIAIIVSTIASCSLRPLLYSIFSMVIALGVASIQLVPLYQALSLSVRTFAFPYSWVTMGAATMSSLKHFVSPFIFGDQYTYTGVVPNFHEHAGYVGTMALALAFIGMIGGVLRKTYRGIVFICMCIVLFAVWVSFAQNAPVDLLHTVWKIVPVYKSLRFPTRHYILIVFSLSALSGVALQQLGRRFIHILIAGIILVELILFARHFIEVKPVPESRHDPVLIEKLTHTETLTRWLPNFGVWVYPRESLDFPASMQYGIFNASGYDVAILKNYYEFADSIDAKPDSEGILEHDVQIPILNVFNRSMDFLNIAYITVPYAYDPLQLDRSGRLVRRYEDPDRGYRFYENTSVLPRYFVVGNVVQAESRSAAIQAIKQGSFRLSDTVMYEAEDLASFPYTSLDCAGSVMDNVVVEKYMRNSIELRTDTACTGVLVSSEVYFPGWEAWIDGEKTPIYQGNLAFRTIVLPKGSHSVEFRYVPYVFYVGLGITILTLMMCAAIIKFYT